MMAGWCQRKFPFWALVSSLLVLGGPSAAAPTTPSMLAAESPLPILRGIAFVEGGSARVYLEDPQTGAVTAYGLGDAVGDDGRIERIQHDGVILRRPTGFVRLLFGVPAAGPWASEVLARAHASTALGPPSASARVDGLVIGSGQPWLDWLGIPPGALAQAIQSAPPAPDPDD
jgi:hypothetical protein